MAILVLIFLTFAAAPSNGLNLKQAGLEGQMPYTPEKYGPLAKYTRPATEKESAKMYKQSMNAETGSKNYRAYVGPPKRYGDMSGSEFSLLFLSGLQETDLLLDIGCGSMRLGRLAIPFLQPGHYHCIEPNTWLIQDGLHFELGNEILYLKAPEFASNYNFEPPVIEGQFQRYDYMVAQSIFSHTGQDMYESTLKKLANYTHNGTIILATSVPKGGTPCSELRGWLYPGVCTMTDDQVLSAATKANLFSVPLTWPHERQKWYAYCPGSERGRARCQQLAKMMPRTMVNSWEIRGSLNLPHP